MTFAETLAGRLARDAERDGERIAFTFLPDGEGVDVSLSRAELHSRAIALAAYLQGRGLTGERVLLLHESSLDSVVALLACFYAGAIAVPAAPPARGAKSERLHGMVQDAQPRLALAGSNEKIGGLDVETIVTHTAVESARAASLPWQAPDIADTTVALLQYTSGSTSAPKGVVVTHVNLIDNQEKIRRAFQQAEQSVIVSWLPLHHDMGLIGAILQPVYTGARAVFMPPQRFTEKPVRWLDAITRYQATTSGGPDFAYSLCASRVTDEQRDKLDLRSWRVAFNGAEPVRPATLRAFAAAFAPAGFAREALLPCYGLAEATLFVCGSLEADGYKTGVWSRDSLATLGQARPPKDDTDIRELTSCGPVSADVLIVDPDTRTRLADGQTGEIWICGASVGGGYWQQPAETRHTFGARLGDSRRRHLRTGDLGFLSGGRLFVTGRLKDLIILRGKNHDPQDIELTVERALAAIRRVNAAAVAWESDGPEALAIVIEAGRLPEGDQIQQALRLVREAVACEHGIAPETMYLVARGALPRTTSGKLRRSAVRTALAQGTLPVITEWRANVAPHSDGQTANSNELRSGIAAAPGDIAALVATVLGTLPDAHEPLVRLGLDSMKAATLSHRLAAMGCRAEIADLLGGATLADLEAKPRLSSARASRSPAAHAPHTGGAVAAEETTAPLSIGQQALWFQQRVAPASSVHHVAVAARVHGEVSEETLASRLNDLTDRHALLRARFSEGRGEPHQHLEPRAGLALTRRTLATLDALPAEIAAEVHRPFSLADGPPARAALFEVAGHGLYLVLTAHHLVADLWSLALLLRDLDPATTRSQIDGAPSYFAYVHTQRDALTGPDVEEHWRYWQRVLHAPPAPLFPTDAGAPDIDWRGGTVRTQIDAATGARVEALARAHDTTAFVVLLAAFQIWLRSACDRRDVVVASPVHGRTTADRAEVAGYFVNLLPIRNVIEDETTFDALIARTRQQVLDGLAHELPFPILVERLAPERRSLRTPLVEAVFVWQDSPFPELPELGALASGFPGATVRLGDLTLEAVAVERRDVPFDLTLTMARVAEGMAVTLDCRASRFDTETATALASRFAAGLGRLVAAPDAPVVAPRPSGSTEVHTPRSLHDRFAAQAARRPEAIAVRHGERTLTYGELEQRANRLARHLQSLGARAETLVAVHLERSLDLAAGILGISKSGAGYLPIDERTPAARVQELLRDSGARLLITSTALDTHPPDPGVRIIHLDAATERAVLDAGDASPIAAGTLASQIAYCIYTSGSTGRPKGVLVTHDNALRLFETTTPAFAFDERDVWTLFHSPAFDFSVWEFWGALLHGGQVVMVPYAISRTPRAFLELLVRDRVTVLNQTPSAFRELMREAAASDQTPALRLVIFGGEALDATSLRPWASRFGTSRPRLVNMYGITETTVHVTQHVVTADEIFAAANAARSVIGRPLDDLTTTLVSDTGVAASPGEPGEIWVGGAGVARGYLGQPALTAERFVPDPFAAQPGARAYRSGDLGVAIDGGVLIYAGRADRQIKLRGVRIELSEIEAALRRLAGVRDAAVVFREAGGEAPQVATAPIVRRARHYLKTSAAPQEAAGITAYVVPESPDTFEPIALAARLRSALPDYLVPRQMVAVDRLPLNANGKLDVDALPHAALPLSRPASTYAPPADATEATLADVWARALELERVGIDDNYFTIGGDSIRALKVIALAEERGLRFDVADLLRHQTIRTLRPVCRVSEVRPDADADGSQAAVQPFALIAPGDRQFLPAGVVDAYPLSRMQAGLIYHASDLPATSVYRATFVYEIAGPYDDAGLRQALQTVVDAHPILRTSFDLASYAEPLQMVHAGVEAPMSTRDLRGLAGHAEREAALDAWLDEERQRDFDLAQPPLFRACAHRLTDERFALGLTCHDAILDGWSTARLLTEWLLGYARVMGDAAAAPAPPHPTVGYVDFVAAERQALASTESAAFWRDMLRECTVLEVPGAVRAPHGTPDLRVLDVPIPRALRDRLLALSRHAGVSLKHVLLAAHMRVLSVTSGQTDVVTGLEANGRVETGGSEFVLGQHLNTIPFRQPLAGGRWLDLVRDTAAREQSVLPFRRFPYAEIQRQNGRRALYETTFNYTHFHVFRDLAAQAVIRPVAGRGRELTHYTLKTEFNRDAFTDDLNLDVIFDRHRIDEAVVGRIGARYLRALQAMAEAPTARYEHVSLLSDEEGEEIRRSATGPQTPPSRLSVPDLFETQAAQAPDREAVRFEGRTLTYRELDRAANRLARTLQASGIGPERCVAIYMERSLELAIALLGVLKAGAAYVPLDPDYPAERLQFMARQVAAPVVLTQAHLRDRVPAGDASVLCLDGTSLGEDGGGADTDGVAGSELAEAPARHIRGDQAAYVIFTSGSTGRPKGAVNTHAALTNRLLWMQDEYGFGPDERVLQKTPYSFDVSVWELFCPLIAGGTLVMARPDGHHDPEYLAQVIAAEAITTLHFVPSMLSLFLDFADLRLCGSLRRIICSGEALSATLRDRCGRSLAAGLHNLYGPTEAAVDVTAWDCSENSDGIVPIGQPIDRTTIWLLDSHQQSVPPGAIGELYIGGVAAGRGYWRAPALTAARFLPDPFSTAPGARLYRTGDLARTLPGGAIEYLGRADAQVKVHGVRIEVAEIEAVLRALPGVRDCAVLAVESAGLGTTSLAAFVVMHDARTGSAESLLAGLSARLPRSMTPASFTFLDALPLTPSGKLDRRALIGRDERDRLPIASPARPADDDLARLLREVEELPEEDVAAWLARMTGDAPPARSEQSS